MRADGVAHQGEAVLGPEGRDQLKDRGARVDDLLAGHRSGLIEDYHQIRGHLLHVTAGSGVAADGELDADQAVPAGENRRLVELSGEPDVAASRRLEVQRQLSALVVAATDQR